MPTVREKNGWTGATIVRVVRNADLAVAADGRHAHGGPAAQNGKRSLHFTAGLLFPGSGARVIALVISRNAIRTSNSTFCRRFSSVRLRLTLVLSFNMQRDSFVMRAGLHYVRRH